MNNLTSDKPLTDDKFARLTAFLDSIGKSAMNIEMLDGLFVALICGPDTVLPGEYPPQIWGEDFSFESDGQAAETIGRNEPCLCGNGSKYKHCCLVCSPTFH